MAAQRPLHRALRALAALGLAVLGLHCGLGLLGQKAPQQISLEASTASEAPPPAFRPPTAEFAPPAPQGAACEPFDQELARLGDLEGESPVERVQPHRFLSVAELQGLSQALHGAGQLTAEGRGAAVVEAARCQVLPEPSWALGGAGFMEELRYRDGSSRHRVAVDVDLRPSNATPHQPLARVLSLEPSSEELTAVFRDRWVYVHGDSTMRQVCCELVKLLSNVVYSFEEFKNLVRQKVDFVGAPDRNNAAMSWCTVEQPKNWEFRHGACENLTWCQCDPVERCEYTCNDPPCNPNIGVNEMTSQWYFSKLNMTLTFDWKARAFQRYDRWLLRRRFAARAPDLYIFTAGMHDCFWPATRHLGPEYQVAQLEALFDYVAAFMPNTTRVIWMPGQFSRIRLGAKGYDVCLEAVNSAARREAAVHGFTLVDRDRLLRSLLALVKEHKDLGWYLDIDGVHFLDYVQVIIRQYLLSAIVCVLRP